jgi:6-pyruvoyltetrahydropterin/6-carboxytetrahydropterin synthase
MHEVTVTMSFSAAHNLRGYRGKCEALHGHNWKVEAAFRSTKLDRLGMVVDFGDIKQALRSVLDGLDHAYLNEHPYFKKVNPTSENIACWIFQRLKPLGPAKKAAIAHVKVWETDTNVATYTER